MFHPSKVDSPTEKFKLERFMNKAYLVLFDKQPSFFHQNVPDKILSVLIK
jgi:hypothetical protein